MQRFFMQVKQKISYFLSANFVISLISFLFLFSIPAFSQKSKRQLEINQFVRLDWYPKFQYSINPVNSNSVKIHGTSWGVDAFYKFLLKKKIYFKAGVGYYKYSFSKINQTNSLFGSSNNRIIENYVPPGGPLPNITFTTDRYWYNSIALRMGIETHKNFPQNILLNYGVGWVYYYTFSQKYHLGYPEPFYKTGVDRFFGFSVLGHFSVQKRVRKISIGPSVDIPIYDIWKKDDVFPQESNNEIRHKWFNGLSGGVGLTYYF